MTRDDGQKHKFLCGHDERHWFVAAILEQAAASTVKTAMVALQPPAVRVALRQQQVKRKDHHRRRNDAFLRQGEWFFLCQAFGRPFHHFSFVAMSRSGVPLASLTSARNLFDLEESLSTPIGISLMG